MTHRPILWITLGIAALLVASWLVRGPLAARHPNPADGETVRGRAAMNGDPTPDPDVAGRRSTGGGRESGEGPGELTALMTRFAIDSRALPLAQRAAWQAAEFRRLTPSNEVARAAYLGFVNDREKLHLELEFGITNAAFLHELLALDTVPPPPAGRPELLVPTPESASLHEYNRRLQGDREELRKVAVVLQEHGLDGFPVVLRAGEDLTLLELGRQRQASLEASHDELLRDPDLSAEFRASLEADRAASRAGFETLRTVLAASFARITGVSDPALPTALEATGAGRAVTIIRPDPESRELQDLLDRPPARAPGAPVSDRATQSVPH